MSQIVFRKARLIPLLLLIIPPLGTLISYCLAIRLDHVKPFLPFLSHAAGYPPEGAVFTSLIEVTVILGVLTSVLRYATVKARKSFVRQKIVNKLNSIALWTGCLAFLGMLYVAVNPVGFPAPNKQDYMWNVFATHNAGALGAMICFNVYVLIQSYLTYTQSKIYKSNAVIHILLTVPIVMSSVIILGIFYFVVVDVYIRIVVEKTGFAGLPNIQYPFFPLMAALQEWIFAFFLFVYLSTFSTDFKYIRIVFQLQPKSAARKERTVSGKHSLIGNGHSTSSSSSDHVIPGENEKKKQ